MREPVNKTALAYQLGIARSMLYYEHLQPQKDWRLKTEIEDVLHYRPSYGHKRIARELERNKKAVLRVMKIYGLKPYRRRRKPRNKAKSNNQEKSIYPNLLLNPENCPQQPGHIWATDFTYLPFKRKFIYLATVLDLFTREIVGFNVLTRHDAQLVSNALIHALSQKAVPQILHSDQGREYASKHFNLLTNNLNIIRSMSRAGCPWENGYQEAFYSQFKVDLGDPNQFEHLGELVYAIYRTINIYNQERIHTALKMPPAVFAEGWQRSLQGISLIV
jgi:transposase InsO family protein